MKRMLPILLTVLTLSSAVLAQAPAPAAAPAQDPALEKALSPAPAQMKAAATVIKWKSDFTYDTLRKGTNRLVCYERPIQAGQPAFSAECTSIANLERVATSLKIEASTADPKARRLAFETAEKAGTWPKPEFGSIFYNMTGADAATARSHATIAVPGATNKTLGLPENGQQGGAWIMEAGSSAAHIMMPGH
jgi:hypothetical protein